MVENIANTRNTDVESNARKIIYKESLICGLYLGLIMVAIYVLSWLVNPLYSTNTFISGALQLFEFGLLCIFILSVRKLAGGFWSYSQAFSSSIIITLLSVGLKYSWNFILYNFIDRSLGERIGEVVFATVQKELLKTGISQGVIDTNLENMKSDSNPGTPKIFLLALVSSVIASLVISLILAVIVKKNKPVFTSV